jgi:hypothetical protein
MFLGFLSTTGRYSEVCEGAGKPNFGKKRYPTLWGHMITFVVISDKSHDSKRHVVYAILEYSSFPAKHLTYELLLTVIANKL